MALLKAPDWDAAVTVILPDPPEEMAIDDGFVPRETVAVPVATPAQVDVNFTGPDI